jgi:DNA-binding PadR family transcriptional regulator
MYSTIRTIIIRIMKTSDALSTLSLAILGLISKSPSTGYDLRKLFASSPIGAFSSSPGAIYPALKRCEKNGWLSNDIDNSTKLRPRQVFSLTDTGREVLRKELLQHVDVEAVIRHQRDLILRFAFMDDMLSRQEIRAFLEAYASAMEDYLGMLEQHKPLMPSDTPLCGFLAMEQGMDGYRANVRWARRALLKFQTETNT